MIEKRAKKGTEPSSAAFRFGHESAPTRPKDSLSKGENITEDKCWCAQVCEGSDLSRVVADSS